MPVDRGYSDQWLQVQIVNTAEESTAQITSTKTILQLGGDVSSTKAVNGEWRGVGHAHAGLTSMIPWGGVPASCKTIVPHLRNPGSEEVMEEGLQQRKVMWMEETALPSSPLTPL